MAEITAAGKVPLLVGGTMLYFRALLHGLAELPQADAALRAEIDAEAAALGWPAMHAKLASLLDPLTAARLHPTDSQRLQRALEICQLSGRPMSELLAESEQQKPPYDFLSIGLLPADRAVLHERIARRFDEMLLAGLDDEVRTLRAEIRTAPEPAVHALRRLPPDLGSAGGFDPAPGDARPRHFRHPPAGQAPDHLADQFLRGGEFRLPARRSG
jgi:tRNA dimethylallyltransferase